MDQDEPTYVRHHIAGEEEDSETELENPTDSVKLLVSGEAGSGKPVKLERCGGCTYYMEPLVFFMVLVQFPLMILMPQFVLSKELERLTGNDNITMNRNSCLDKPGVNQTGEEGYDPIKGNYTLAQSAASMFNLESSLVSFIPAVIVVMFIGPYSDKRGRKIGLILPMAVGVVSAFMNVLIAFFDLPIELLLAARFIYGCGGSWVTIFMACLAFTADITTKEERQFRITVIEISAMAPSIIGSAGSGFIIKVLGYTSVFFIVFLSNVLILLYTIFIVPETVKKDPTAKFCSNEYIKKSITVVAVDDGSKRRWKIILLLIALFFALISSLGANNVTTLFMLNKPLCFGSELVGIQTAFNTGVAVLGSGISAKVLGMVLRDAWIAVVGGVMNFLFNVYMFFVTNKVMMFAGVAFKITYLLVTPTLRAILSKIVQPDEVGAVFGCVAFIEGLCELVGNVIFNPIYSYTQAIGMPSLVFLVMAAIVMIGVVILIIYAILTRKEASNETSVLAIPPNDGPA